MQIIQLTKIKLRNRLIAMQLHLTSNSLNTTPHEIFRAEFGCQFIEFSIHFIHILVGKLLKTLCHNIVRLLSKRYLDKQSLSQSNMTN